MRPHTTARKWRVSTKPLVPEDEASLTEDWKKKRHDIENPPAPKDAVGIAKATNDWPEVAKVPA